MTKCFAGYTDCHLHEPFWFWDGERWVTDEPNDREEPRD